MYRKSKDEYYLSIAKEVAHRGTCRRRNYGAVIVKNDEIISTGYTGSPRGTYNCCDRDICRREQLGCKPGERYELCRSVHAEQNAIISASRQEMIGSTLYLYGFDATTGDMLDFPEPCLLCKKMILNAGIQYVVCSSKAGTVATKETTLYMSQI